MAQLEHIEAIEKRLWNAECLVLQQVKVLKRQQVALGKAGDIPLQHFMTGEFVV